jgi:hypothetical protein
MAKRHNLMMMRTRNLGVVGTRGAGVRAFTKGPWYSVGKVTREAEAKEAEQKSSKSWNPFKKC